MEKVKAVIFDVGGVLWLGPHNDLKHRLKTGIHEFIAKKLKVSMDQYLDAIDTAYARSILGQITEKKALETMSRNLGTDARRLKNLFFQGYKRYFKLNTPFLKEIEKLKKRGYRLAILSDQTFTSKDFFIIKRFRKIFNPINISCDIGFRKPDKKAFSLVLKRLGVRPGEAVFIDNQQWNTKPARRLGLHTVLFKNNTQALKGLHKIID